MGEVTLRNLDEALLIQLSEEAGRRGIDVESLATDLLRRSVARAGTTVAPVARGILQRRPPSPISAVALLDELRNEGR